MSALRDALEQAFSGLEFEENAAAAAGEGEWSWFRWLATTTADQHSEREAELARLRAAGDPLAEVAADLKRDHDMPPNKDRRNYNYRMGWWDAIRHAAKVVERKAREVRAGGVADTPARDQGDPLPMFAAERLFDQRDEGIEKARRYRLAWLSARRRANRGWLNYHAAVGALDATNPQGVPCPKCDLDAPREKPVSSHYATLNALAELSGRSTDGRLRDAIARVRDALWDEVEDGRQ